MPSKGPLRWEVVSSALLSSNCLGLLEEAANLISLVLVIRLILHDHMSMHLRGEALCSTQTVHSMLHPLRAWIFDETYSPQVHLGSTGHCMQQTQSEGEWTSDQLQHT
jgi:hypothetical protein